jgi:putative Mn2+ efflux pump MntP
MNATVVLGLITGSDNLYLGAAWGSLPMSAGRRAAFALAFGAAELGMTLVGHALGAGTGAFAGALAVALIGGLAIALTAALVLVGHARRADLARLSAHPAALVAVPLALSFDNLASGAALGGLGGSPVAAALGAGLVSAAIAAIGLFAAGAVAPRLPRVAVPLAGAAMLVLVAHRVVEALP